MVAQQNGSERRNDEKLRECFDCHNTWYTNQKRAVITSTTPIVSCPRCMSSKVKTYDTILPAEIAEGDEAEQ